MTKPELPAIDKIRFCVIDKDGRARSDMWFIHSTGDSVYAAPRRLGGTLKLSLHPAGVARDGCDCQFGHTASSAQQEIDNGFQPLPLARWTRPATPDTGAVHVASIVFPTDFLSVTTDPPKDGKVKFAIPLAPPGQVAEAGLFFSRETPSTLEEKFIRLGGTPLIYMDLPNGEFVSLVVRHTTLPDFTAELEKMRQGQPKPLSGAPKPGESFEGRAVVIGTTPADGRAFYLAEAGSVTVSRAAEDVPAN